MYILVMERTNKFNINQVLTFKITTTYSDFPVAQILKYCPYVKYVNVEQGSTGEPDTSIVVCGWPYITTRWLYVHDRLSCVWG